tara:strand:- start:1172 stop:1348 length:177 start_codon:yes stop_codon:yes gene_type:complete
MKAKRKIVAISVYDSQWKEFQNNCATEFKSASGVIRELIAEWNIKCKQKERKMERGKN